MITHKHLIYICNGIDDETYDLAGLLNNNNTTTTTVATNNSNLSIDDWFVKKFVLFHNSFNPNVRLVRVDYDRKGGS